jgi:ABC-type transporter Mla subunit MlaD
MIAKLDKDKKYFWWMLFLSIAIGGVFCFVYLFNRINLLSVLFHIE